MSKRHPALAMLVSLSLAGTCLAAPALAGAIEVDLGSAAIVAEEAAASVLEVEGATTGAIELPGEGESTEAEEVIEATEGLYAFGGLQLELDDSFEIEISDGLMLAISEELGVVVNITPTDSAGMVPEDQAEWEAFFTQFVDLVAEQINGTVGATYLGEMNTGFYGYSCEVIFEQSGTEIASVQAYVPLGDGSFTMFQIAWENGNEEAYNNAGVIASTLHYATDEAIQLGAQLGQEVTAAGITLCLPDELIYDETSLADEPTYFTDDGSFMLSVTPAFVEDLSGLAAELELESTEDVLDLMGMSIADGLEGTLADSVVLENQTTNVYTYIFSFADGGTDFVGVIGMVPLADDTVTGVLALLTLDNFDAVAEMVEAIFATIELA